MKKNEINKILAETLGVALNEILPESNLYEDFNCGTRERDELMQAICRKLNIDNKDTKFDEINTVNDIFQYCDDNTDEF